MKKSLLFAVMAAMAIGLVGCGGTTNTENTDVETTVEESSNSEVDVETNDATEAETETEEEVVEESAVDLEYATLYDKYVGYTLTIGYPKDADYTVEETYAFGVAPQIIISDGANSLKLNFYDYKDVAKKLEDAKGSGEIVKEFTAGDMSGFVSMAEGKTSCMGYMTLVAAGYPDTGKNDTLTIVASNKDWDADAFKEFYESDALMTMLESITFEKSDASDYPGMLTYDRLVGMNVDPAGAFEIEYDAYDTYLIKGIIKVDGKELGYVSATVDKNSALSLDEALKALQESKSDKYENANSITYGSYQVNMMRYNNSEEYHGYIDIDGTAVKITVLVKSGTDTSEFYGYVGTVIDGIYIPQ